ncbi:predicted protein [Naegleria gruberi]|uniref:Predicted protein n=1 Tax=Naegleria gruberi TaxID=5762 RepID=D2VRE3_NAEGR|nr:uncharacterized protein NAEGRDRAFT_71555 [Naegleria gruberi]EFC40593.1 predicted protein [Naegleria gruberi]|eukprot:XP_002673337.1 predicted protein [Naegleria gruberi strain NEG-M]
MFTFEDEEAEQGFPFENSTPEQIINHLQTHDHPETIINSQQVLIMAVENCKDCYEQGEEEDYVEWFKLCEYLTSKSGVNINVCRCIEDDYDYPLSIAIESCDLKLIELILSHGADPNNGAGFRCRNVMINLAIQEGSMDILKLLLKYGADVNKFNTVHCGRFSPWNCAYSNQEFEILDFLLNLPNISLKNSRIFHEASANGDVKMVELLIKNHFPILDLNHGNYSTPLFEACKGQFVEVVKLLVPLPGIDINLGSYSGRMETPLQNAIRNSNIEIVSLLISHGAIFTESDSLEAHNNAGINLYQIKLQTQPVSQLQKLLHSNLALSDTTFEYQ